VDTNLIRDSDSNQLTVKAKRFAGSAFLLRTPLLPFSEFEAWGNSALRNEQGLTGCSSQDAASDIIRRLRLTLRELIDRPEVRLALYTATPSLLSSIHYWISDPDSKKGTQVERSLVKYFSRMCGRSTPFGVASGCSVGRFTNADALDATVTLVSRDQYTTFTRLDFSLLNDLAASLMKDPAIAREATLVSNSSLYKLHNVWHYVEIGGSGQSLRHSFSQIESDEILDEIIRLSRKGSTRAQITDALLTCEPFVAYSSEEIDDYLDELVENQVLLSNLLPAITGPSAFDHLISEVGQMDAGRNQVSLLRNIKSGMASIDEKRLKATPDDFEQLSKQLEITGAPPVAGKTFQVDLFKPLQHASLPTAVLQAAMHGLDLLGRISKASEPPELTRFRLNFVRRFEHAWIPLNEALDEDRGVGFESAAHNMSPLVKGWWTPGDSHPSQPALGQLHRIVLERLTSQDGAPNNGIDFAESEIETFGEAPKHPIAFDAMLSLIAPHTRDIKEGKFKILLKGFAGPSGVRMLSRFCYLSSDIEEMVRSHIEMEESERPDAIFAEVVSLPEPRLGNVTSRPILREFEIPYLGRSGASSDRLIMMDDLLVTVAEDNSIILWSRSLQREIIPRLSNAHGFMNRALSPTYRLLCCLQHQNVDSIPGFNWGPLDFLPSLPRITCGRYIFAPARWRLSEAEVDSIRTVGRWDVLEIIKAIREKHRMPRWVVFQEGDSAMPVDMDNPLSVDALAQLVKRSSGGVLAELLPDPGNLFVKGPEGDFLNEFIIPVVRSRGQSSYSVQDDRPARHSMTSASKEVKEDVRHFPIGSEWLYFKCYGGILTLDKLLIGNLERTLEELQEQEQISQWFFLRYGDPESHIRLRLHVSSKSRVSHVMVRMTATMTEAKSNGVPNRFVLEPYQREIERFGGIECTRLSEDLFCADSIAVVKILSAMDGGGTADTRWKIACLGVDTLLADCGLNLEERRALVDRQRDLFQAEFKKYASIKKTVSERFRASREELAGLLWERRVEGCDASRILSAIDERSARVQEVAQKFRELAAGGEITRSLEELCVIWIHLHINRMIQDAQRAHEMMIYSLLSLSYESRLARR
jgi:lantibiotic biosynthesis protein